MNLIKPSIPKGTRDFTPAEVAKRNFIFNTIRATFEKYGFEPIETPAMENLSTLTGKYGDEGDKLLFKILNSGEYLKEVRSRKSEVRNLEESELTPLISEKGLRYDLTVPFARFVVMHQHEITFPFKRYQIQPVWRADRPQKGRYREFYQCDADIIGSDALLNEVELIQIYDEVYSTLGLENFTIKINNRKILTGLAEAAGIKEQFWDLTIAIDKLDKIGMGGVEKELIGKNISQDAILIIKQFFEIKGNNAEKLDGYKKLLSNSEAGQKGIAEVESVLDYIKILSLKKAKVELDITLARGLTYYTGTILEAQTDDVKIGSIGGGGRYDDLTGIFGLNDISGVGISFGADRIYDVMEELNLFPEQITSSTQLLFVNFDEHSEKQCLKYLQEIRQAGVKSELYPSQDKIKKQMKYANNKNIPFVALVGEQELQNKTITLKNMKTGKQENLNIEEIVKKINDQQSC